MNYTICGKQAATQFDNAIDREQAALDRAIDREEERKALIKRIKDEMFERRMAVLSDDDIVCAFQSLNNDAGFCSRVRHAIKTIDAPQAFGSLKALVECWIREDCETEARNLVGRPEQERH